MMLNDINPDTATGKMKLMAISKESFTDEEFEREFLHYEVPLDPENKGLNELFEILEIVKDHRPKLYDKFATYISKVKELRRRLS